jgi:hypothetical protein
MPITPHARPRTLSRPALPRLLAGLDPAVSGRVFLATQSTVKLDMLA